MNPAQSPMPELSSQPSSAPLPPMPVFSPLPPVREEPRQPAIPMPAIPAMPEPLPMVPPADASAPVESTELSELLAQRRRLHPLYAYLAAIVLLLAIILGALYWAGIDFTINVSSPGTPISSNDASDRPVASVNDSAEPETPTIEVESAAPDPPDASSDELSPAALEGQEVSELMYNYQYAWLQAMNDRSMEPLLPYVTQPDSAADGKSVYNIVEAEILGNLTPSGTRVGGLVRYSSEESIVYEMPMYMTTESVKVSDDKYQLRINKRVRRDATVLVNRNKPELGTYPPLTTYKETSYTYNVVRDDEAWKVQSIEDDSAAPPVCYANDTFSVKYERKDGTTSASNGNCPGLAPSER